MVCETISRNVENDNKSDVQFLFEKYEQMRIRYDVAVQKYEKEAAELRERCDYLNDRINEVSDLFEKAKAECYYYKSLLETKGETAKEGE